jgi:hypothetical protein
MMAMMRYAQNAEVISQLRSTFILILFLHSKLMNGELQANPVPSSPAAWLLI